MHGDGATSAPTFAQHIAVMWHKRSAVRCLRRVVGLGLCIGAILPQLAKAGQGKGHWLVTADGRIFAEEPGIRALGEGRTVARNAFTLKADGSFFYKRLIGPDIPTVRWRKLPTGEALALAYPHGEQGTVYAEVLCRKLSATGGLSRCEVWEILPRTSAVKETALRLVEQLEVDPRNIRKLGPDDSVFVELALADGREDPESRCFQCPGVPPPPPPPPPPPTDGA